MAIPKQITFVTFDVYGTLIDWDEGAYDAFKREADRDGFTIERDELIPLFHRTMPRATALVLLPVDLADHYSQMAAYLRLNGMLPPSAQPKK